MKIKAMEKCIDLVRGLDEEECRLLNEVLEPSNLDKTAEILAGVPQHIIRKLYEVMKAGEAACGATI